jgi:hypothetical protein
VFWSFLLYFLDFEVSQGCYYNYHIFNIILKNSSSLCNALIFFFSTSSEARVTNLVTTRATQYSSLGVPGSS